MGKKSTSQAATTSAAVDEAMLRQTAVLEKQQDWYENTMYPWLQEYTEKTLAQNDEDRALNKQNYEFYQNLYSDAYGQQKEITDTLWNRYQNQYMPVEDSLIQKAADYNTAAEAERQAGLAISDVDTAYAASRKALQQQMSQYGVNPTSGQYLAQQNALNVNQAAARAAAANQARSAAEELGWTKQYQVAALGQGYLGNTMNANSSTATTASNNANTSLTNASALTSSSLNAVSNLANIGLNSYSTLSNGWGNYGSLGVNYMNAATNATNVNNQVAANNQASLGSMIGTGVGVAAAL